MTEWDVDASASVIFTVLKSGDSGGMYSLLSHITYTTCFSVNGTSVFKYSFDGATHRKQRGYVLAIGATEFWNPSKRTVSMYKSARAKRANKRVFTRLYAPLEPIPILLFLFILFILVTSTVI